VTDFVRIIQKCAHIIAEIFKQNDKKKEIISQKKMMSQLEFFLHNLLKVWVKRYVVSNKVELW